MIFSLILAFLVILFLGVILFFLRRKYKNVWLYRLILIVIFVIFFGFLYIFLSYVYYGNKVTEGTIPINIEDIKNPK